MLIELSKNDLKYEILVYRANQLQNLYITVELILQTLIQESSDTVSNRSASFAALIDVTHRACADT